MATVSDDIKALVDGDKAAWDQFVARYAGLILATIRRFSSGLPDPDDLVQDVFLRLCKDDFRLLRTYDPAKASLSTWLTIIARSAALDRVRKRRVPTQTLDETPEGFLTVAPPTHETVKIPDGLLSQRQHLILSMIYHQEMDVAEIAVALGIDPQTVRSTHHKALLKLRVFFKESP